MSHIKNKSGFGVIRLEGPYVLIDKIRKIKLSSYIAISFMSVRMV